MALFRCSGAACARAISVSAAPGGNPVGLQNRDTFAVTYTHCGRCGAYLCDRCVTKMAGPSPALACNRAVGARCAGRRGKAQNRAGNGRAGLKPKGLPESGRRLRAIACARRRPDPLGGKATRVRPEARSALRCSRAGGPGYLRGAGGARIDAGERQDDRRSPTAPPGRPGRLRTLLARLGVQVHPHA
jgi:hypothetical protein